MHGHRGPRHRNRGSACANRSQPSGNMQFSPILNPPLPYIGPLPPLQHGLKVIVQGFIPQHGGRFHINFSCGPGLSATVDTALHFNPRFEGSNQIVRNSFLNGHWGSEERHGGFPLAQGYPFEATFQIESHCYKVLINGVHFCDYNHRTAKERVTHLVIEGSVQIQTIHVQSTAMYPACPPAPTSPVYIPVPYKCPIPGGFTPGRRLHIVATPKQYSPDRFAVDMCNSEPGSPGAVIAFHFNPRFQQGAVVRNTCTNGSWGAEERGQAFFPFQPGVQFQLLIQCEHDHFKVAVNSQHFTEYRHRYQPLNGIGWFQIGGDLQSISYVQVL